MVILAGAMMKDVCGMQLAVGGVCSLSSVLLCYCVMESVLLDRKCYVILCLEERVRMGVGSSV
jgi:hypothetical protein